MLRWLGPLLSAHVLSHSPRFCVWLSLLSLCGAGSFSFEFFHLSLDLSTDVISLIPCVELIAKKKYGDVAEKAVCTHKTT